MWLFYSKTPNKINKVHTGNESDDDEQFDTRIDDESTSDDDEFDTQIEEDIPSSSQFEYHYLVQNNTIIQKQIPIQSIQSQQTTSLSPLQISFPLQLVFTGGIYNFEINKQTYQLSLPQSCMEDTLLSLQIKEQSKYRQLPICVKYSEHKYFRREGDDLIGSFVYSKSLKGKSIVFPYIVESVDIPSIILGKLSYHFDNFGFVSRKNQLKGKYIVYVSYK